MRGESALNIPLKQPKRLISKRKAVLGLFLIQCHFFSKNEILTIQKKISEIIINVSEEINIKSKK